MFGPRDCIVAALLVACVPTEKPTPAAGDAGAPRQDAAVKVAPRAELPKSVREPPLLRRDASALASDASVARILQGTSLAQTPADRAPARDAPLKEAFRDRFERTELGDDWYATSPIWKIQGGRLCGRSAKNHPLWLKRRLPANARIEFDAISSSPDGDIKVEVWGDGKSFAQTTSYTNASSYVVIFGGWKNQFHVLARVDEHAPGRPEVRVEPASGDPRAQPVKIGQTYHFKIERSDGKTVRWLIDDIEILSFTDPQPLKGVGHDHFGFNDWDVPVCFDNVVVTPLEGS